MRKNRKDFNNNNNSSVGIDVLSVLQIVLIVLKCFNLIDWTWMQVFIPSYIWLGLIILGIIIMLFLD